MRRRRECHLERCVPGHVKRSALRMAGFALAGLTLVAPCESKPRLRQGQIACVFGKQDGKRIGIVLSSRPASDGVNRIVTVAADSAMKQFRDVSVPAQGTVEPCE